VQLERLVIAAEIRVALLLKVRSRGEGFGWGCLAGRFFFGQLIFELHGSFIYIGKLKKKTPS
jgi:hypothetical protein